MEKFLNIVSDWFNSNKRNLLKIFLWLLYMACIVVFLRYVTSKNDKINEKVLNGLEYMNNYEYECYYNDLFYSGKVNNNIEIRYIDEIEYYFENEWYKIEEEKVKITEEVNQRITPIQVYQIVQKSTYVSKSKVNDMDEIIYKVSLKDLGFEEDTKIEFYVYLNDDKVGAITIFGQACAFNKIGEIESLKR